MTMTYVGHIAAYRQTRSPGRLAWSECWRPSGAGLRTSDEPGELSQWLSRDDSIINIVIQLSKVKTPKFTKFGQTKDKVINTTKNDKKYIIYSL